jgi:putative (di)nucleoside polyphosphate hydrolase
VQKDSEYFRANVGAAIVDDRGRVLSFERHHGGIGERQLPQGGIMPGEDPKAAMFREVLEETSIPASKLQLIDEIEEWLGYELPERYRNAKTERGQVQKWFLLRFLGRESDISADQKELTSWQWITARELIESAAPFRQAVYRRVCTRFAAVIAAAP